MLVKGFRLSSSVQRSRKEQVRLWRVFASACVALLGASGSRHRALPT